MRGRWMICVSLIVLAGQSASTATQAGRGRKLPRPDPELVGTFPDDVEVGYVFRLDGVPAAVRPSPADLHYDLTEAGAPILLAKNVLLPVAAPGVPAAGVPISVDAPGALSSFAIARDGVPLAVTGQQLGVVTPRGFQPTLDLPRQGMRVAAASGTQLFLYGGGTAAEQRDLYLYRRDGALLPLFRAPSPIQAVSGFDDIAFVAFDRTILMLRLGEQSAPVYHASEPITSIAASPPAGIFFATASRVGYVYDQQKAYVFLRTKDARVSVRGGMLFVMLGSGDLLRCSPVTAFQRFADSIVRAAEGAGLGQAASESHVRGVAALGDRDWLRAVAELSQAEQHDSAAAVSWRLGQAHAGAGHAAAAIAWMKAAVAAGISVDRVQPDVDRLSALVRERIAKVAGEAAEMVADLQARGVRPAPMREFARLTAMTRLEAGDDSGARATLETMEDVDDRDAAWIRIATDLRERHPEAARRAAGYVADTVKRAAALQMSPDSAVPEQPAVERWRVVARQLSKRAPLSDVAVLGRMRSDEVNLVPLALLEYATNISSDYFAIKRLEQQLGSMKERR